MHELFCELGNATLNQGEFAAGGKVVFVNGIVVALLVFEFLLDILLSAQHVGDQVIPWCYAILHPVRVSGRSHGSGSR